MTAEPRNDHYRTLGVERTASAEEIKSAYHALAHRFHPDVNPNTSEVAAERFKEITAAYSVLSDSDERKQYDSSIGVADRPSPDVRASQFRHVRARRGSRVAFDVRVGGLSASGESAANLRTGLKLVLMQLARAIEQSIPE